MDVHLLLLTVAFSHRISEPSIESGYERFCMLSKSRVEYPEFCDAVAACVREGLIYEPVRLPEGALQCHWHLELTPKGVAAAQRSAETSLC